MSDSIKLDYSNVNGDKTSYTPGWHYQPATELDVLMILPALRDGDGYFIDNQAFDASRLFPAYVGQPLPIQLVSPLTGNKLSLSARATRRIFDIAVNIERLPYYMRLGVDKRSIIGGFVGQVTKSIDSLDGISEIREIQARYVDARFVQQRFPIEN